MNMLVVAAIFTVSALLTYALCRIAQPLGVFLGVMDIPSGHKRHAAPTPAVGGVIAALIGSVVFLGLLPWTMVVADTSFIRPIAFILVMSTMLIGFIDDRRHIRPLIRLVLGVAVATVLLLLIPQLVVRRVSFPSINLVVETGAFGLPFTILCLLALKNAINMADGRNGLVLGMAIIWTVFFLSHAMLPIVPGLICLLAVLLVLFAFNWRGKLFLGDCGSYGLATFFGVLALALHKNAYGDVRTAEIVLLFLIPLLDTGRLIAVRVAHRQSPFAPDSRHLHHLLDNAIGWRRGWVVYMALVALPLGIYQILYSYGVHLIAATSIVYALVVRTCSLAASSNAKSGDNLDQGALSATG